VFTGIVEERGRVRSRVSGPSGIRLDVGCRTVAADAAVGSSIAVNGVCLTTVDRGPDRIGFDLAPETVARSTLSDVRVGDPVNLERAVTMVTRLGGHVVQGHVDGTGMVVGRDEQPGGGAVLRIRPPGGSHRYVVEKGSVAVDGVSLTVAAVDDECFTVALIPHTLAATTLGAAGPGTVVNIEVDVLAKYVERLVGRSA
jgi:riboflavin synthase